MIPGQCLKPSRLAGSRLNRIPREQSQEIQPGKPIDDHRTRYTHIFGGSCISTVKHLSFCKGVHMGAGSYLHQGMPVCDGLAWIRQHFTPVVSAQPLSFVAYLTHADDLIVTYTVKWSTIVIFSLKFWYVRTATTQLNIEELGKGWFFSLPNAKAQVNLNSH